MLRNAVIFALIALLCALPFALRPSADQREWREGDPVLVAVSPHTAAIREEFARGFSAWHVERYGSPVRIDWRAVGGATEIMRYLRGEYLSSYRAYLRRKGDNASGAAVAMQTWRPDLVEEARYWDDFRSHDSPEDYGCKIDIFFGAGTYDQGTAERLGITVAPWPEGQWPVGTIYDADGRELIPRALGGEVWRTGVYCSSVLSGFGICSNPDRFRELGIENLPSTWSDLADPRLFGLVGVCDPTKSGSIAKAFEMILHSQCRKGVMEAGFSPESITANERKIAEGASVDSPELREYQKAVEQSWMEGIYLLQRIGANSRYFTDAAGKVPIDVSSGDAAAGICIDFYGRVQAETTRTKDGVNRLEYITPRGGSSISGDPVAMLRGADHPEMARRFIEYVLSEPGQRLWNGLPGSEGGPVRHALRRMPVHRDFYPDPDDPVIDARARARAGTTSDDLLSSSVDSYSLASSFEYVPRWTASHFNFLRSFVRAMCMDSGDDLRAAWKAIIKAGGEEACPEAVAMLRRMPEYPYPVNWRNVTRAVKDPSMADGLSPTDLQTAWTEFFRASYREAAAACR